MRSRVSFLVRSVASLGFERLQQRAFVLADVLCKRVRRQRSREQSYLEEIAALQNALNHVGRGIQMIDGNGFVVVSNNRAAELLGVPADFLSQRPHFSQVFEYQCGMEEFGGYLHEIKARFANGQIVNRSECYRRTRPNGQVIEVESVPLDDGGVVRTHTDVTDRHEAEQRINFLAHHDFLTNLPNRANFHVALTAALSGGQGGAVGLIDLDNFKQVNDTFGHQFGDALLKEVAERLRKAVRPDGLVARLGGDEFAFIVPPSADLAEIRAIAEAVVVAVRRPFSEGVQCLEPSVSVGMSLIPQATADEQQLGNLLRQADLALYDAKQAGRNCWRLFDPAMMQRELAEQSLLRELRTAIAEQQFEIFYQPIINVRTLSLTGFEALVRWHHPIRGLLAASEFITIVELSGLIVPLGSWVLRQACRDAASWPSEIRLLVNLSPRQLSNPEFISIIKVTLAETGLSPTRLELEITESSILHASEAVKLALNELRRSGIRVALDDFGTGYSSLSHIRTLHFDTIKIDRSFVADASVRIDCGAIVKAIAGIAHDLGIETIAEGVETSEQLDWIRAAGCNEAQGYLFSRPVPLADALDLLAQPDARQKQPARTCSRSIRDHKPCKSSICPTISANV